MSLGWIEGLLGMGLEEITMRFLLIPILIMSLVLPAIAQEPQPTFHLTSVHKARDNEKSYHTAFSQLYIEGTVGNKKYTLEELDAFGAYHFEVGQDYPVAKISNDTVKLQLPPKKGRPKTTTLNLITVEEIPTKN